MIAAALSRRRVLVIPTAGPVVWAVAGAAEAFHRFFFGRPAYFNLDKAREATAGSWVCSPQAAADELGFSVTVPLSGAPSSERRRLPRRRVDVDAGEIVTVDALMGPRFRPT